MNNETMKALTNLDKATIQTTALCHAIVTILIDKSISTQEEIADGVKNSFPNAVAKAMSDFSFFLNEDKNASIH